MKNSKYVKILFLITGCMLFATSLFAQSQSTTFAMAGGKGIYIYLSNEMVGTDQKIVSYKIERKAADSDQWEFAASVSSPDSLNDFISRLQSFALVNPEFTMPTESELISIFNKFISAKRIDSLMYWGTVAGIRAGLGTIYFDSNCQPNENYQYRVTEVDYAGAEGSRYLSNEIAFPGETDFNTPTTINLKPENKNISLTWLMRDSSNPFHISVNRRDNFEGDFTSIEPVTGMAAHSDSIFIFVTDTSVYSNSIYQYFIRSYDMYFNEGPVSDTVLTGSYDFSNVPAPTNISAEGLTTNYGIQLSWNLPEPLLVKSIQIFRSIEFDEGYELIAEIPSTDQMFIDQKVEPTQKYFYYFVLRGPLGELSDRSAKVFAFCLLNSPPFPPVNIDAKPLPNGVELSWGVNESHLKGYYVYRNDGVNDSLYLLSELIIPTDSLVFYSDTSKGLSGKLNYTYVVQAENTSHVAGVLSQPLSIRPGIPTKPPVPVNLKTVVAYNGVQLYWQDMRIYDDYLRGYIVYRRVNSADEKISTEFETIIDTLLNENNNHFVDTTIVMDVAYEYAVESIDMFGGKSGMCEAVSVINESPLPPAPTGLTAVYTNGTIILEWSQLEEADIKVYNVHRYSGNESPIVIASVEYGDAPTASDSRVNEDELYFYYVTATNTKGKESKRSEELGLRAE